MSKPARLNTARPFQSRHLEARWSDTLPTQAERTQASLPAPAACLLPPSLFLFQNANLASCGADPDASWGTRGTRSGDPHGLWLGPGVTNTFSQVSF